MSSPGDPVIHVDGLFWNVLQLGERQSVSSQSDVCCVRWDAKQDCIRRGGRLFEPRNKELLVFTTLSPQLILTDRNAHCCLVTSYG